MKKIFKEYTAIIILIIIALLFSLVIITGVR